MHYHSYTIFKITNNHQPGITTDLTGEDPVIIYM